MFHFHSAPASISMTSKRTCQFDSGFSTEVFIFNILALARNVNRVVDETEIVHCLLAIRLLVDYRQIRMFRAPFI